MFLILFPCKQISPADGCLTDKGDISLLEGFKEDAAKIKAIRMHGKK